jgi:shikimate dehydrogenase
MDSNDGLPCDPSGFSAGMIVAEAVGGGNATPLLIAAEARGCTIHLGIHMLKGQTDLILDFILG